MLTHSGQSEMYRHALGSSGLNRDVYLLPFLKKTCSTFQGSAIVSFWASDS